MKTFSMPLFLICISFQLSACAQTPPIAAPRPSHWASPIKADANLHRVDDKLYRSEQPIADDYAALAQLNIKSIINLRYFNRRADRPILQTQPHIKLLNHPLLTWHITPRDLAAALWTIEQNQKDGAVLLHCYHGADRTGIVIAFYRIIYQNWSPQAAKAEMQQGGFGYHSVWKNLENLLTEQNISQVKAELAQLQAAPLFRQPEKE